jgi:hypothetical protein
MIFTISKSKQIKILNTYLKHSLLIYDLILDF